MGASCSSVEPEAPPETVGVSLAARWQTFKDNLPSRSELLHGAADGNPMHGFMVNTNVSAMKGVAAPSGVTDAALMVAGATVQLIIAYRNRGQFLRAIQDRVVRIAPSLKALKHNVDTEDGHNEAADPLTGAAVSANPLVATDNVADNGVTKVTEVQRSPTEKRSNTTSTGKSIIGGPYEALLMSLLDCHKLVQEITERCESGSWKNKIVDFFSAGGDMQKLAEFDMLISRALADLSVPLNAVQLERMEAQRKSLEAVGRSLQHLAKVRVHLQVSRYLTNELAMAFWVDFFPDRHCVPPDEFSIAFSTWVADSQSLVIRRHNAMSASEEIESRTLPYNFIQAVEEVVNSLDVDGNADGIITVKEANAFFCEFDLWTMESTPAEKKSALVIAVDRMRERREQICCQAIQKRLDTIVEQSEDGLMCASYPHSAAQEPLIPKILSWINAPAASEGQVLLLVGEGALHNVMPIVMQRYWKGLGRHPEARLAFHQSASQCNPDHHHCAKILTSTVHRWIPNVAVANRILSKCQPGFVLLIDDYDLFSGRLPLALFGRHSELAKHPNVKVVVSCRDDYLLKHGENALFPKNKYGDCNRAALQRIYHVPKVSNPDESATLEELGSGVVSDNPSIGKQLDPSSSPSSSNLKSRVILLQPSSSKVDSSRLAKSSLTASADISDANNEMICLRFIGGPIPNDFRLHLNASVQQTFSSMIPDIIALLNQHSDSKPRHSSASLGGEFDFFEVQSDAPPQPAVTRPVVPLDVTKTTTFSDLRLFLQHLPSSTSVRLRVNFLDLIQNGPLEQPPLARIESRSCQTVPILLEPRRISRDEAAARTQVAAEETKIRHAEFTWNSAEIEHVMLYNRETEARHVVATEEASRLQWLLHELDALLKRLSDERLAVEAEEQRSREILVANMDLDGAVRCIEEELARHAEQIQALKDHEYAVRTGVENDAMDSNFEAMWLCDQEASDRTEIESAFDALVAAITTFFKHQREERNRGRADEATARIVVRNECDGEVTLIVEFLKLQMNARMRARQDEETARALIGDLRESLLRPMGESLRIARELMGEAMIRRTIAAQRVPWLKLLKDDQVLDLRRTILAQEERAARKVVDDLFTVFVKRVLKFLTLKKSQRAQIEKDEEDARAAFVVKHTPEQQSIFDLFKKKLVIVFIASSDAVVANISAEELHERRVMDGKCRDDAALIEWEAQRLAERLRFIYAEAHTHRPTIVHLQATAWKAIEAACKNDMDDILRRANQRLNVELLEQSERANLQIALEAAFEHDKSLHLTHFLNWQRDQRTSMSASESSNQEAISQKESDDRETIYGRHKTEMTRILKELRKRAEERLLVSDMEYQARKRIDQEEGGTRRNILSEHNAQIERMYRNARDIRELVDRARVRGTQLLQDEIKARTTIESSCTLDEARIIKVLFAKYLLDQSQERDACFAEEVDARLEVSQEETEDFSPLRPLFEESMARIKRHAMQRRALSSTQGAKRNFILQKEVEKRRALEAQHRGLMALMYHALADAMEVKEQIRMTRYSSIYDLPYGEPPYKC